MGTVINFLRTDLLNYLPWWTSPLAVVIMIVMGVRFLYLRYLPGWIEPLSEEERRRQDRMAHVAFLEIKAHRAEESTFPSRIA